MEAAPPGGHEPQCVTVTAVTVTVGTPGRPGRVQPWSAAACLCDGARPAVRCIVPAAARNLQNFKCKFSLFFCL